MKSMVEADCGGPNPLVGLAQNFGTSNQRIAPPSAVSVTRGATALLPSAALGEQFANDFLQQKASETMAPSTFSMKALSSQLPKQSTSTTSLANNWSTEYATRPGQQLASQWSQQYNAARPAYETAWAGATNTTFQHQSMAQSSTSVDSAMWSAEFLDNAETSLRSSPVSNALSSELAESWAQEYAAGQQHMWDGMESEWETIRQNLNMVQKEDLSQVEKYEHQVNNPFLTVANPMVEGDRLMQEGDLGNAMLAYEAAVQKDPSDAQIDRALQENYERLVEAVEKNPEDANAWCRLGLSHAENEHDSKAIAAFNNCLKIQPNNEEALLALSVSLANESVDNEALNQLEKWLVAHQGGDPTTIQKPHGGYSSFLDHDAFKQAGLSFVEERFLTAARQQAGTADADLQNALGILYNLSRNYERAVECMKLAIASRPEDARLWNRLGATLANGDRTPEAVAAYREALQRYPLYVRARYNLGISCLHLQSYREAVEHFVSALELQKGGKESSSIWPTLRSATIRMRGAPMDLLPALDRRDLNAFKSALGGVKME